MEGCKQFKFGQVSFQVCENFLIENWAEIFLGWMPFQVFDSSLQTDD